MSEKLKKVLKSTQYLLPPTVVVAIFFIVAAINGLYPFGDKSISWCDMNQQAIPILCEYKDVLSGKASLFISYANAGGMNFYALFIYYCTSPFNLLVAFVDKADMSLFMNVLVLLKMAAAACTAYIYLRIKNGGKFSFTSVGLSVLYGFSGYIMMYYQIVSWLDGVYMFPLFLLGLEKIDRGESFVLYSVTLALNMLFSYYVTYMLVIYALVRFLAGYALGFRERKRAINFVIGSFIAALATAAVYIPVLVQYADSARTGSVLQGLRNSAPLTAYDTSLLAVLCLSAIFPFLFDVKTDKETSLDRIMVILTAIPLISEPINKMWQTGSYMSFPSRYAFMIIFTAIAFVGKTLGRETEGAKIKPYIKYPVYGAIAACFAFIAVFGVKYSAGNIEVLSKYSGTLWGSEESLSAFLKYYSIILLFSAALFALYKFRIAGKAFVGIIICALAVNEAFFSIKPYMVSPSHGVEKFTAMMEAADLTEGEEGFYRVNTKSKMFAGSDGIGINAVGAMGYNTLSHYTSLTSGDYMNAIKRLGYSSYWMEVADYGGTKFSDAFLINKFTFVNSGLSSAKYATEKYGLAENPTLPFGIVVGENLSEELSGERSEATEQLYRDITGKSGLITRYSADAAIKNGVEYSYENGVYRLKLSEGETHTLTYNISVSGRQTLYFDCFDLFTNALRQHINESFDVRVNGRTVAAKYPAQSSNGILRLGEFKNRSVRVELTVRKDFYGFSFGVFGEDADLLDEALASFPATDIKIKGNKITGTVSAVGGKLLLCLPYDAGYRFKVNGKRVKAEKVLTDFIAVPLEEGENRISARYIPKGFTMGAMISAAGVAAFVLLVVFGRKREYFTEIPLAIKAGKWVNILALSVSALAFFAVYVLPLVLMAL